MSYIVDNRRAGPYRSRRGILLGVCRGLADHLDISAFWVRLGVIAVAFVTAFWPVIALYVVAAMFMKKEPVVAFVEESDLEFYESFATSRSLALHRLKRLHEKLDRRLQRLESRVTARGFDWDRRMRES